MSSLLPPNATATEQAIEAVTEGTTRLPVPLRELWNPDTCPAELLPWLAWALSLDTWKDYWPDAVKRQRIKAAITIQRQKGTVKSVRDVVDSFGGDLALKEWWQQDPPRPPHTFDLVLEVGSAFDVTDEYQLDIIKEVDRTKPVRSHYTLSLAMQAESDIGAVAAARVINYRRLQLEQA